ncbi:MAG: hypothetical protein ACRDQE_09995 [Gaiellales bacterium]
MEGGTEIGLATAASSAALVAVGVVLGRSGRAARGWSSVIGPSLGVATVAAVCGVLLVAAGTDAYAAATTPSCSDDESQPTLTCVEPGDRRRGAAAMGLLGGLVLGIIGGCVTAWRCSRSLRMVAGGVIATLGATVLLIESLIVLVLWSA